VGDGVSVGVEPSKSSQTSWDNNIEGSGGGLEDESVDGRDESKWMWLLDQGVHHMHYS
jgi:hypothetical protein